MPSRRSVLVEHKAKYRRPMVRVGDEAVLSLPAATRDATVTCTVYAPDGESQALDVRHRESPLFSDHVVTFPVDADGDYRYIFLVDGARFTGRFVVRPAQQGKRKRAKGRGGSR